MLMVSYPRQYNRCPPPLSTGIPLLAQKTGGFKLSQPEGARARNQSRFFFFFLGSLNIFLNSLYEAESLEISMGSHLYFLGPSREELA